MSRAPGHTTASLLAILAACSSAPKPEPLTPPPVESGVRHFAGTILSGARPDPEAAGRVTPEDALLARCTVTFVADLRDAPLAPLAARTRLIVSAHADEPLLPVAELAVDARIGTDAAAIDYAATVESATAPDTAVPLYDLRAAVPTGVTAVFYSQSIQALLSTDDEAVRKLVGILVAREPDTGDLSVAILFEDLAPESRAGPADSSDQRTVVKRQMILLEDVPAVGGPPIVLAMPSNLGNRPHRGYVARLQIETADPADERFADAVARCVEDIRAEGEAAQATRAGMARDDLRQRTLSASLDALDLAQNHRPTLVFLAGTTADAPLALDVALSGDAPTLAAWAQLVTDQTGQDTPAALAWTLERTAFELLAARLDRGELSVAERGTLTRHAGEAGALPGALTAILASRPDPDEFQRALLAENLGFLDAPDPSARVRAYDWLVIRGLEPDGYDPLADRRARRAALDRWNEARREAER